MSRKFCIVAVFAMLTAAAPARAATITWYLNAAPEFPDNGLQGETVTGFFDWDTVTNTPTDWSITGKGPFIFSYSCGVPCPFTAINTVPNPSGSGLALPVPLGFDQQGHVLGGQGVYLYFENHQVTALDDPTNIFFLSSFSTLPASSNPVFNKAEIFGTVSAPPAVPSPVPLPASLPLFGSGVLALAGLAWRRGKVSRST
jgi:hypothetical protein